MEKDIVKSNYFMDARYYPGTVWRMRVLLVALMQVKATDKLDPRKNFVVTAANMSKLTGSVPGYNYQQLEKAAKDLQGMYITVFDDPGKGYGIPDYTRINVISSVRYYKKSGKISLRFNEEIIPYISSLHGRFTQYEVRQVMPMRSAYGIRLYELSLRWKDKERCFSVQEFKNIMGLENKYNRLDVLKKRVITPALKDINTYSDIRVSLDQRKTGRTVSHLIFNILKPKKEKRLTHRQWLEKNNKARPGESWEKALARTAAEFKKSASI